MEIYSWTEKENYVFEFLTESFDVYWIIFKQKEEHFTEFCSDCRDIYEIEIKRVKGNKRKSQDFKIRSTIIAILQEVMSNRCHSVVYVCDNRGGKAECREVLFNRYFEDMEEENDIDKYVKSLCDEELTECFTMNFIADKNCDNYEDNVTDFMCEHMDSEE